MISNIENISDSFLIRDRKVFKGSASSYLLTIPSDYTSLYGTLKDIHLLFGKYLVIVPQSKSLKMTKEKYIKIMNYVEKVLEE